MPTTAKQLPGPKGLPLLGNLFKLDLPNLHNQIEEWAKEYGDVYLLNLGISNQLVITRPSLIQKILLARPNEFVRMKKMDGVIKQAGVDGAFNAEGESWKMHRSIVAKGLDVKHLKDFYQRWFQLLNVCIISGRRMQKAVNPLIFSVICSGLQLI